MQFRRYIKDTATISLISIAALLYAAEVAGATRASGVRDKEGKYLDSPFLFHSSRPQIKRPPSLAQSSATTTSAPSWPCPAPAAFARSRCAMSKADGAARDSSTICADGVGHTMRRRAVNSYDNVERCALTTALARAAVAAAACGRSPSCTVEGRMHHEAAPYGAELGVRVLFSPEKIPPTPYPRARHASCRRSPKNAAVLVACG